MNYRIFILVILIGNLAFAVNESQQTIEIANNSAQNLKLGLTVPEYTKAVIAMTSLKEKVDTQTMLYTAIINDSAEGIKKAVQAGADVNKGTTGGKSPLLLAVLLKRSNAVKALLMYDVMPNLNDENIDTTLLDYSVKLSDFKSALLILQKMNSGILGKNKNYKARKEALFLRLLQESVRKRDPQSTTYLLKNSADLFDKKSLILNDADEKSNTINMRDIFYLLREKETTGHDPIPVEFILDLIQELINHGYAVNNIWRDTSIQKLLYSREEILELFIKNGANPHYRIGIQPNYTYPIFKAIAAGNVKAVQILLENGAFVNEVINYFDCHQCCYGNKTPLSYAINHGKSDIVPVLFEYGANL